MILVPAVIPHTVPVVPTVATVVDELVHVPPVTPSLRGVQLPVHIVFNPVIGVGAWFTVTVVVT